ncbi:MAG: outer membrane beta-barrel protein [Pseudomonadota bacterium]
MKYLGIILISLTLSFPCLAKKTRNKVSTKTKTSKSSVQLKPVVGTLFNNIRFNNGSGSGIDMKVAPGISVGLGLIVPTGRYFSLESGLFYSVNNLQYDLKTNGQNFSDDFDVEFYLQRISIPLLARIHPWTRGNGFYVKTGFMNHIQLSSHVDVNGTSTETVNQTSTTSNFSADGPIGYGEGMRPINIDAVLGGGYDFKISRNFSMQAELGYQLGLLGFDIDGDDNIVDTFFLNLGFGF